jgi:hypothetical protein
MSIMFAQTTRLELTIVAAALLVLLLCRQPPRSGNADVPRDAETMVQELTPGTEDAAQEMNGDLSFDPSSATGDPRTPDLQTSTIAPSSSDATSDNSDADFALPSQPRKRMGMVDARNCAGLKYQDVLYGEVTVRWVWDGQKLVPHKVIEVKEKNGVTSIWSFDEHKDVVLSEIRPDSQ